MTIKILLTGSQGQIGSAILDRVAKEAWRNKIKIVALSRNELDITDADQVATHISRVRPDIVINAAGYTKVDQAEADQGLAFAVNCDGPANLAQACATHSIKLIHLSTDFVFDGSSAEAYSEHDPLNPLNVYGRSKAAGENAVRTLWPDHVIVRTAWAYSSWGDNFMKVMVNLMLAEKDLKVVDDQYGSPTSATDIAETILKISTGLAENTQAHELFGTYHYTGKGITTWYGFASEIMACVETLTGKSCKLDPVPTSGYPTPACRPANSALNCDLINQRFNIAPVLWQESVRREAKQYLTTLLNKDLDTVA